MLNIWYSNMLLAYSEIFRYITYTDTHLLTRTSGMGISLVFRHKVLASISPALVLNIGQWSTSRKVNEDYGRSSLSYHWWLSIVPTFWIRYSQFVMFMINSVNSYK